MEVIPRSCEIAMLYVYRLSTLNQLTDSHVACVNVALLKATPSSFLVAFAILRKAIICFVMSARPYGTTPFPLDGFS
jgi:hypothetical protein